MTKGRLYQAFRRCFRRAPPGADSGAAVGNGVNGSVAPGLALAVAGATAVVDETVTSAPQSAQKRKSGPVRLPQIVQNLLLTDSVELAEETESSGDMPGCS